MVINMKKNTTVITNIHDIQSGLNTHHHDQVIFPVSFKVIKIKVNSPPNPMEHPELLAGCDIILFLL